MTIGNQEDYDWGALSNCYAYAAKCAQPAAGVPGATARPGVLSGQPPDNNGDVAGLVAGVLADGGINAQTLVGTPDNLPVVPANFYLVAMITKADGFHFMRRDEETKRWSWKDGNHGSVKLNVWHVPTDHYVYINDANLNDILVTHRGNYFWLYSGMTFQQFFAFQNTGFNVGA